MDLDRSLLPLLNIIIPLLSSETRARPDLLEISAVRCSGGKKGWEEGEREGEKEQKLAFNKQANGCHTSRLTLSLLPRWPVGAVQMPSQTDRTVTKRMRQRERDRGRESERDQLTINWRQNVYSFSLFKTTVPFS